MLLQSTQAREREQSMQDLKKELLAAAEGGSGDAQLNLGVMLKNRVDDNGYAIEGSKAEVMHAEAVKWLLSAAEQDLPRAQLELAEAYAGGGEAPKDYVKACGWFLVAIAKLSGAHRHRARSGYALVCSRLTPAQITKATHFAQIWKPKTMHGTTIN
jgi:TPR repeat protein